MPALLEVSNLVKTYGHRRVVNGVTFEMNSGEIVGLLGPNGAGKTTTFRMTIGLIKPDSGTVAFHGKDITRLPVYRRARRGLGYMSQEQSIFQRLTVEQNLLAILETLPLTGPERRDRMEKLLDEFGLGHVRGQHAALCSGGEKRRIEIARALVTEPSLLMLDEPFAGVDPIAVEDIQKIIHRLREKGIGILLTDHKVRETLAVTDRSYIIFDGHILAHGPAAELVENETVRRAYLGESFKL
jgi:lipopolysaccharide export system ATP-binding protein